MEFNLNIPNVDLSLVRKYSLADIDEIDFSSSDDFAIVVEKLKAVITLDKNIETFWTDDHEQVLWQFVIDPDSCIVTCYFFQDELMIKCDVPKVSVTELFYFIKISPEELVSADYHSKLLYGKAQAPLFESLYQTLYAVFSPIFTKRSNWSKCIKIDYLNHLTTLLSELFEIRARLHQELILYIPEDIINNSIEHVIEQKDTLNHLEETVMKWLWLLKNVMMKQDSDIMENSGPIEEIKFWKLKSSDLDKCVLQLERPDVKKCIKVLKTAKLVSYAKYSEVYVQLQEAQKVSLTNVKFLTILMEPCQNIEAASLSEIPKHLPLLLDLVRIIYNNSPYYGQQNEISNLLNKVNNFVISSLSKFVPLEEIFNNESTDQKEILLEIISCCKKWLEIFDFSEEVHKKYAPSVWSVKSISSLVNLFIHRCEELIQVCDYKIEFECDEDIETFFEGHRCHDIVQEFKTIEVHFRKSLQELGENKNLSLEIMKPAWNENFKKFKEDVYDIEIAISKLMLDGFENLCIVEEGFQILKMFQKYSEKQAIQRDFKRCIKLLYQIYFDEVDYGKSTLLSLTAPKNSVFPFYGGKACFASILSQRLEQIYKNLRRMEKIWIYESNVDIDSFHEQTVDSKDEYIHTLFLQWIKTIPEDPFTWLKEPIIIRKEGTIFLEINLSSNILNLIQELYYWSKITVEIPQQVIHLLEKSDVFYKRIMKVIECIKNYNRTIKYLLDRGEEMFSDLLSAMEANVLPTINDFNWSAPSNAVKSVLKVFTEQTKVAKEVLSQYEKNKENIKGLCFAMGKKSLFTTKIHSPQNYSEFIQTQVTHREEKLKEIATMIKFQINEINQTYNAFKVKKLEMGNFSSCLSKEFIETICSAMIDYYVTSLKDIASLFSINRENKIQMPLKIYLTLKNNQLYYTPNFKEFCGGIEQLIQDTETALSQLMVLDGLTSGNVNEQNYFLDIVNNSESIRSLKNDIDVGLYILYTAEKKLKSELDMFAPIWETKIETLLKEYESKGWNCEDFITDIKRFLEINKELQRIPRYRALEFCLVDCQQLKEAGSKCAGMWKTELGSILRKISCSNLQTAYELCEITQDKFREDPCNISDLTNCIQFLKNMRKCAAEVENTFPLIHRNFKALKKLGVFVEPKVLLQHKHLPEKWKNLINEFEKYYAKLQKVQAIFQQQFLSYHEELEQYAANLECELIEKGPFQLNFGHSDAVDLISYYHAVYLHLKRRDGMMRKDAVFFHMTLTDLGKLKLIESILKNLQSSWFYVKQYDDYLYAWGKVSVSQFDVKRTKQLSDALKWKTQALGAQVKGDYWVLLDELIGNLNNLNKYFTLIKNVQEPSFRERHWKDLGRILDITCEDLEGYFKSDNFTLDFLRNISNEEVFKSIATVSITAREEFKIEQSLEDIEETWKSVCFKLQEYEKILRIDDIDIIVETVEKHQASLRMMKASKYVGYFSERVSSLGNSMLVILDVTKQAELFQGQFFLFQKIFSEQAIQAQLPKEAKEVQELNTLWKNATDIINAEKLVWTVSHQKGFLESLTAMNKGIEHVKRSLELYLDSKRRAFPRLYFLSNDDLISIIGQKHPEGIQPYFIKCFDSIKELKLFEKVEETLRERIVTITAVGMYSEFEELVEFSSAIFWEGPVESFLSDVEESMKSTLKSTLPKCTQMLGTILSKEEYNFTQNKWLNTFPGQICQLSMLIVWTADVTNCIKTVQETAASSVLKNLRKKWRDILNQFVLRLKNETIMLMQRKALLMVIVLSYACDIIEYLVKFVCNDVEAFEWLVHLRYYITEKNTCYIRQAVSEFIYEFEYLGKHEPIVVTPLTERCFLSITTAMFLNRGVILKGCRNSGKTETLKGLGAALGKFVLTLNCSENLDHKSIVRMLSGVAQIGAWGLFEDFNLMKVEIISLLSQQIQHIFNSLASKKHYFSFWGKDVPLKEGCGLFFVLNPDHPAAGYDCPSLFRPVAFKPPDVLTIIQVYLLAYDFSHSKALATDIQLIFTMVQDQLYEKTHLIFGLDILTKFLKYLGKQKKLHPKLSDVEIITLSFKDMIMPKLDSFDLSVFESILDNVLGSAKKLDFEDSKFLEFAKNTLDSNSLQSDGNMTSKLNQLNKMKGTNHAIIILGESGSGKTTLWQTLKDTLGNLRSSEEIEYPSVEIYVVNPQAYALNELYGYFTEERSWKDGLFPSILKEACGNSKFEEKWIVLNGPIHMEWLCSLNSMLDCTKTLTLINGERLMLPSEVVLIFETTSLDHCSPNFASRCGIVFSESNKLQWKLKLRSWIQKFEANLRVFLTKLSEIYLEHILEFCQQSLKSFADSYPGRMLNSVTSFINLMNIYLKKVISDFVLTKEISRIFWLCAIWSIGALLDENDRILFHHFIKELDSSLNLQPSIFEFGLDKNFGWKRWTELSMEKNDLQSNAHFENLLIPNKDTISYQIMIETLLESLNPVLLIGERGCGKSILIENMQQKISISDSQYIYTKVNISPQITSSNLQQMIETQLSEKAGGLLIPPVGKKLIAVLDDFKIVTRLDYESQSYVELLHMTFDNGFWYNRKKWKLNYLQDVCFLASADSTHVYGHPVHPLLNRFNILKVLPLNDSTLSHIFVQLLKWKFPESLANDSILSVISIGCIRVYKSIQATLLPIPSKLHYLFGIKDLKKILSHLFLLNENHLNDKLMITKFWFHEFCRQFSDRLQSSEDQDIFSNILFNIIEKEFLFERKQILVEEKEPLFVKFLNPNQGYKESTNYDSLKKHIEEYVLEQNLLNEDTSYDIVFFKQNINYLCRIIHNIENPCGNIILLGAAGTGKKTLCKIAALVLKQEVFELNVEIDYGIMELKHDLHQLLYDAGVRRKDMLFLLNCDQDTDNYLFHYLSEILTNGLPFDIFSPDELNVIYTEISAMSDIQTEKREYSSILVNNIKEHLHVAICLNNDFTLYKTVFLKYPALLRHCTVNWFYEWPDDALETIAVQNLKDINLSPTNSKRMEDCCFLLSAMHKSVLKYFKDKCSLNCQVYEVSCTFIKLINSFKKVLNKRQRKVQESLDRLVAGLQKINETQEKVNEIAIETKKAQERLIIAERECEIALRAILQKKTQMAIKKQYIEEKKVEIEKKEKICRKIAIAAEEDLNAALPALEEARKALEALNKKDISEIKSYAKPPVLIEIVLEAVMILRDSEPSWAEAKRQLGSPSFLKELKEYDRDNISDAALAKVAKYIKKAEFQPNLVGKVSVAAKSLCIWVKAMYLYGEIYKNVRPKKERLRLAKEELEKLQKTLASLYQELLELEESLLQLEKEHKMLLEKKEEYAREAKELALKLERANNIIAGLSTEKEKWEKNIQILSQKKEFVIGDSLIATGFLTYLGPHEQTHRYDIGIKWKKKISDTVFLYSPDFELASFFVDESIINEWKIQGLPSDEYSHEGATIVNETSYWPFMIDPETQAVMWLKNLPHHKEIKCVDFGSSNWMSIIELSITNGNPVLLQNINPKDDSSLRTLLNKPEKGSFIYFNNKKLKMDSEFQLFFSTNLLKPQFSSVAIYQATIVNFTIKQKGLEDQLLPLIVQHERSDLETKKETLVKNIQDCKNQLSEIENTILKLLNESEGSVLEDEALVQALSNSKVSSKEIQEKLSSSEKTEAIIDTARDKYRPCAKKASILYFVLTDMTSVDPLYVFTLESYIQLFLSSIKKSPKDTEPTRRISKLNMYHEYAVYKYACRSVLEKHSLLLAFHMCTTAELEDGGLDKNEYNFFVNGARELSDQSNPPPNPCSQWLPQQCWDNILQLERLPKFLSLTVSFDENSRIWHDWYLTPKAEKKPLPGIWRNVCSGFQMLLIIRCLRLDRVTDCVRDFISSTYPRRYLTYPSTNLKEVFSESSPNKPLVLFSLSPDINIEMIIEQLATSLKMKYRSISLGKGREKAASQLIIDSAKLGVWAFIDNCHHLPSWLPALEKFVNRLRSMKMHENFRLWLGLSPTKLFPTSILQNSIIMSLDSPKDVRTNMLKLYKEFITDRDIESSTCKSKYRNLLFSLSFFHSILIGRNKFQSLGWSCPYNFSDEDFQISMRFLKHFLEQYKETPWDALKTFICETVYGGHLSDWQDDTLLATYFDRYFCDEACANVKYRLSSVTAYYIPEEKPVAGYIKLISGLPTIEEPDAYGQHSNAEISYQVADARRMFKDLKLINIEDTSLRPKGNLIADYFKIKDLKSKIPEFIDEKAAYEIFQEEKNPFLNVLLEEAKRYNCLLKQISKSLSELEMSLTGKQLMSEEMEELLQTIQVLEVPKQWQNAYSSLKPLGSWIIDLDLRINQIKNWISTGTKPVKFWLPGFISPKSILHATLQTAAKESDVILKELVWEYHVSTLEEGYITEPPKEGIYVSGLLLEGAGWDRTNSILIEPEPMHLVTMMPVIHFKPVLESSVRSVYSCPCYYTSKRTDKGKSLYLFSVDLKTKKSKAHWIKRSTSLVLSTK